MSKKQSFILSLACFLVAASGSAAAVGLRAASPGAALGQPLDFRVAIRIDEGERVEAECVRAEVRLGERLLPAQAVHTRLVEVPERGSVIHVQTLGRVDEPVVEVEVIVGCTSSISRRFVVFADPPLWTAPSPAVMAASPSAPARAVVDAQPLPAPATAPGDREAGAAVNGAASATPVATVPVAARAKRAVARRAGAPNSAGAASGRPPKTRKIRSAGKATPKAPPVSRLRLDEPPAPTAATAPELTRQAMDAIDEANRAVLAAIAAASASQSRMLALEASVARLQQEAQSQAALTDQLRQRAAAAERRGDWTTPLWIAVVALLALAAWMWLRVREVEQLRRQAWLAAAGPAPRGSDDDAAPPPVLNERSLRGVRTAAMAGGLAPPAPADTLPWDEEAPGAELDPESAVLRTQPLVPESTANQGMAARGMSAEELIDLEQQVEFFVVLGQEDAAIDLLVSHLRDSGGASPLPYLKLLDIYQRQGDEPAYRRTRDRFNLRFNALAPDWGEADDGSGRELASYADVLQRIEQVWPEPVEAMTVLEVLLFRHDEGRLFDLPAYRELLFLYSLARDLADADGTAARGVAVDVLLPLEVGAPNRHAEPRDGRELETEPSALELREQPTAPVDLDLSQPSDSLLGRLQ